MNLKPRDWVFEGVYKGFRHDQSIDGNIRANKKFKTQLFNLTDCNQLIVME